MVCERREAFESPRIALFESSTPQALENMWGKGDQRAVESPGRHRGGGGFGLLIKHQIPVPCSLVHVKIRNLR